MLLWSIILIFGGKSDPPTCISFASRSTSHMVILYMWLARLSFSYYAQVTFVCVDMLIHMTVVHIMDELEQEFGAEINFNLRPVI